VIKNIHSRKCSIDNLCIEVGSIAGTFDQFKPKNITVPVMEKETIHMIIKPVIVLPPPPKPIIPNINIFKDDCEDIFPSFKEKQDTIEKRYYRRVYFGETNLAADIFKQGLNLIILDRTKGYKKLYERTFDTGYNSKESDEMADILVNTPASKMIIITGIGKWTGALTNGLVKEIKQIGGPDVNNLIPSDGIEGVGDKSIVIIGRRGLCRYNGIFRISDYDVVTDMKQVIPGITVDPNECLFDNIKIENERNKQNAEVGKFYHIVDIRIGFILDSDNRFAYDAPTVIGATPSRGSTHGGQEIKIAGFSFGQSSSDIKEVLVRGVTCGENLLISNSLLSCSTKASFLGPGAGNIIIKLSNGKMSPLHTCNFFEYIYNPDEDIVAPTEPVSIVIPKPPILIINKLSPRRKRIQDIMTAEC
jgi:hypothetical protein